MKYLIICLLLTGCSGGENVPGANTAEKVLIEIRELKNLTVKQR